METIVGPTSFMHALFFVAQNNIAMKYNCKKVCDNTIMFAIQWANQALTNDDSTFTSLNVKKVGSLFDLNPDLFGAQPEYSFYVSTMKGVTPVPLNTGQALKLAAVLSFTEDSSSIFNPRNIYDFYSSYLNARLENIKIKFHLENDD